MVNEDDHGAVIGTGTQEMSFMEDRMLSSSGLGKSSCDARGISSTAGDNINIHIGLLLRFWGKVSDRGSQYFLSEVASGPERPSMSH